MSKCSNCGTPFKFSDALKGFNPASIKCSGCKERIKSSYVTLAITFMLYLAILAAIWLLPLPLQEIGVANTVTLKLVVLCACGLFFEFLYYKLLATGTIKSNLDHQG